MLKCQKKVVYLLSTKQLQIMSKQLKNQFKLDTQELVQYVREISNKKLSKSEVDSLKFLCKFMVLDALTEMDNEMQRVMTKISRTL